MRASCKLTGIVWIVIFTVSALANSKEPKLTVVVGLGVLSYGTVTKADHEIPPQSVPMLGSDLYLEYPYPGFNEFLWYLYSHEDIRLVVWTVSDYSRGESLLRNLTSPDGVPFTDIRQIRLMTKKDMTLDKKKDLSKVGPLESTLYVEYKSAFTYSGQHNNLLLVRRELTSDHAERMSEVSVRIYQRIIGFVEGILEEASACGCTPRDAWNRMLPERDARGEYLGKENFVLPESFERKGRAAVIRRASVDCFATLSALSELGG